MFSAKAIKFQILNTDDCSEVCFWIKKIFLESLNILNKMNNKFKLVNALNV